jgi:hypothetical protein
MTEHDSTRRLLLGAGTLAAGALALGATAQAAAGKAGQQALNLEDPRERARIRAKVLGSAVEETVYTLYRLHLYGWMGDGNLVPFVSMSNLNATKWKPLPDGNFAGTVYEVGVYTKFDTDELVDVWENPVTGEKREIWQFVGGPLSVQLGPDGAVTGPEATVKPVSMRMETIGDVLFVPSQSAFSFRNPLDPAVWKKEYAGPTFYWDSHFVHAARVVDVLDPSKPRAGAFSQFQNMVSWHPWLGMGSRPGRTYGKAYGSKLAGLDQLPKAVRLNLEKKTPEIFDLASWTKPRIDFVEYVRDRKPT